MMTNISILILFLSFLGSQLTTFKFGADVLLTRHIDLIKGKRVAVITNQTGVTGEGKHIADLLHENKEVQLVALFGPEHGIRGKVEGGYHIAAQIDDRTGVPVYSLYGKKKKPTPEMLKGVDILIFDIQDIGARFYTYISTMSLAMEAAAEQHIPFIVLDRPNPIGGSIVEGPVLKEGYQSFVGIQPIALRHGMTIGELAELFNGEGLLANGVKADLTVIKMENWRRNSYYSMLKLPWVKPSPNIPDVMTALLYPGMGLLEATNVSEGRGTPHPFKNIGAPWLDNLQLLRNLKSINLPGISIDTTTYIPFDMPGVAMNPKYEGQKCYGIKFKVTAPLEFKSVALGIHLLVSLKRIHPDKFAWRSQRSIDLMAGSDQLRKAIDEGKSAEEIIMSINKDLQRFLRLREKYLLYRE